MERKGYSEMVGFIFGKERRRCAPEENEKLPLLNENNQPDCKSGPQEEKKRSEMDQAIETGKDFAKDTARHKKMRCFLSQVLAACSKYLILLDIGMGVSFATIAIPPLLNAKEGLSITAEDSSWIASLVFVWQPVGSMTTVALSKFGRKTSMIFLQLPLLMGWILPYFATSVWELYIASSVMGLGVGFVQAPIATYIGEVTQPQYRGALASVAYSMYAIGQVVIFELNVLTNNWRLSSLYSAVVPTLTALVLYMLPESPIWLIGKGRFEEAKVALKWLRGWATEEEIEQEYRDLLYHHCASYAELCAEEGKIDVKDSSGHVDTRHLPSVKEFTSRNSIHPSTTASETDKMSWCQKYFLRPEMYNPMIFVIIFMYISNGIGLGVFRSYLLLILQALDIEMDEGKASVAVGIVGIFGTIFMVILIPILGKRKLTFISVILTGIGCLALGIYMIFGQQLPSAIRQQVPLIILVEILFATNLGVGNIPWIIISEIFPLKGKTFGTGFVAGMGNILEFIGIKLFWTYVDIMTMGGVFVMYAVSYFVVLVYLYYNQVETEGRPLTDIVDDFKYKRRVH